MNVVLLLLYPSIFYTSIYHLGLDPAKPGFLANIPIITRGRISKMDAKFVDIIHSCGGVLGLYEPLGHADFYPNNGVAPQPGCDNIREVLNTYHNQPSISFFFFRL